MRLCNRFLQNSIRTAVKAILLGGFETGLYLQYDRCSTAVAPPLPKTAQDGMSRAECFACCPLFAQQVFPDCKRFLKLGLCVFQGIVQSVGLTQVWVTHW